MKFARPWLQNNRAGVGILSGAFDVGVAFDGRERDGGAGLYFIEVRKGTQARHNRFTDRNSTTWRNLSPRNGVTLRYIS